MDTNHKSNIIAKSHRQFVSRARLTKYFHRKTHLLHQTLVLGLLAVGTFVTPAATLAAPGDLDATFGTRGVVITRGSSLYSLHIALAMAIQSDGKIVVVGTGSDAIGVAWDFSIVRYNTDGSLDNSFGGRGIVYTPISNCEDYPLSVAIQADGKIVVVGHGCSRSAVVRYNPNGTLDTSFNGTGKVMTSFRGLSSASAVAIQADGLIVVVGSIYYGSTSPNDSYIVRYRSNGSLDTSFNGSGIIITPFSSADSVAIQADGTIVVAGRSYIGSNGRSTVFRYNSNGSVDTSFNGSGKIVTPLGSSNDYSGEVAIQADGKIVVASSANNGLNYDFAIVRYNSDGSLDISFNGSGIVNIPIGTADDRAMSVAIQTDGRIVVADDRVRNNGSDFVVVRLTPNGTLDNSFGGTGIVIAPLSALAYNFASAIAIQADGKIVVAGSTDDMKWDFCDFALVRYQAASTSATVGGRVLTPDGRGLHNATVSMIDSSGVSRTVETGAFGLYSFEGVETGENYTVTVSSKRYRFAPRVLQIVSNLSNVDFVGLE